MRAYVPLTSRTTERLTGHMLHVTRPSPGANGSIETCLCTTATLWTPQIGGLESFLLKHCSVMCFSRFAWNLGLSPGRFAAERIVHGAQSIKRHPNQPWKLPSGIQRSSHFSIRGNSFWYALSLFNQMFIGVGNSSNGQVLLQVLIILKGVCISSKRGELYNTAV